MLTLAGGGRVVTDAPHGHVLANRNCWSPDGRWLVYDVRADETVFDGRRVERVNVDTGAVETVFRSEAPVGVPTYGPGGRLVVLAAPDDDPDWPYAAWHRHGLLLTGGRAERLDAADYGPPFFFGALRGGTHLHTFSPRGGRVASTYEDHVLATSTDPAAAENRRTVAVTDLSRPVRVDRDHPRNADGHFTFVAARVSDEPTPGGDEISRAFSDAWVGRDDSRIAFLGRVRLEDGRDADELFVTDIGSLVDPPDVGTLTTRPQPPSTVRQRRITRTQDEPFPGVSGPRFWPVGDADGSSVAVYRRDAAGRVRLCVVAVADDRPPARPVGEWRFVTSGAFEPTSAFTWSPAAPLVAFAADGSVFVADVRTNAETRITERRDDGPTHHACVFSPDGRRIAYMRPVETQAGTFDQIAVVDVPEELLP